MTSRRY